MRRLLNNPAIQVRTWYEPLAQSIIQQMADKEIRLIMDGSKVGSGHQLLLIAIAFRSRSIPLVWTWVRGSRGHSTSQKQMALLAYVHGLIPAESKVLLVGDAEFGEVDVQKLLQKWQWKYVLRQKGRYLLKPNARSSFQRLDSFVNKPGQSQWLENVMLTAKYAYPVNFLAHWKSDEKDPWLLATNLTCSQITLKAYRRRMWIEETFGDMKRNGFDLESTRLRHFLRLSRLTLAVVLLYVWLVAFGSQVIKYGQRRIVDRPDRRDFSIFRIGSNMAQRRITNGSKLNISFIIYS
jgi:hypothetical protein